MTTTMDAQRIADITAALSDHFGEVITTGRWQGGTFWRWAKDREVFILNDDGSIEAIEYKVPADTLDKLHAASQIVRRMNHA